MWFCSLKLLLTWGYVIMHAKRWGSSACRALATSRYLTSWHPQSSANTSQHAQHSHKHLPSH
jgi:hypothetical protein